MQNPPKVETKTNQHYSYLLVALSFLLLIRLLPALKSPLSTYGYDYGFYAYAINHLSLPSFHSLLPSLWGGYNNPLFYLTKLLHLPANVVLNELYFFSAIFLGLACYYFFGKKNYKAGLFAVALCLASIVQSEAYTMFLWKNLVALPFLVLGFKFLAEKKYWPFALCSLAIVLTHRTTALVYFLVLIIYLFYEQIKNKKWLWLALEILGLAVLSFIIWPFVKPIAQSLLFNANVYVTEGLFLEGQNLWVLMWASVLLALPGIVLYLKNRQHPLLNIFTLVTFLWFLLQLPFYRRMLIYLDISLILYGAYFLSQVKYGDKTKKIALGIILVFLALRAAAYTFDKQPLITSQQIMEIKNFRGAEPGKFVLALTADDAPWLLGFGQDIRLGAPGLFEDRLTYEEWQEFWHNQNQTQLLWKYPRPLYFYERSYRLSGDIAQCQKQISQNFYEYICP